LAVTPWLRLALFSHYHPFDPSTKWLGRGGIIIWLKFRTSGTSATLIEWTWIRLEPKGGNWHSYV